MIEKIKASELYSNLVDVCKQKRNRLVNKRVFRLNKLGYNAVISPLKRKLYSVYVFDSVYCISISNGTNNYCVQLNEDDINIINKLSAF